MPLLIVMSANVNTAMSLKTTPKIVVESGFVKTGITPVSIV
jgi:hypothetical protein